QLAVLVATVDPHVAQGPGVTGQDRHDVAGQLGQHRRRVADKLHLHAAALIATAALADADLGAGGLRQLLADRLDQDLRVLDRFVERHLGARPALLAVPRVDLGDVEALAVVVEERLDPAHFVGDLLLGVAAVPLVEDVGFAALLAAAEHVELGLRHRHDADRDDHDDAEHAPAAVLKGPAQKPGVTRLQSVDHAALV